MKKYIIGVLIALIIIVGIVLTILLKGIQFRKLGLAFKFLTEKEDGEGEVDNIEILKEKLRVKFKNEEGYTYKKYDAKYVKIIKDVEREQLDEEEIQNKKELEELEKLEQEDGKNLGGEKNGI